MRKILIILATTLILSACGKSGPDVVNKLAQSLGAPGCADNEVQKTVLEILGTEARRSILYDTLLHLSLAGREKASHVWFGKHHATLAQHGFWGSKGVDSTTYNWLKSIESQDSVAKELVDEVDTQMDKAKMSLIDIRVDEKNDQIKKSKCRANITTPITPEPIPVEYHAQYTHDGQIYVEVW